MGFLFVYHTQTRLYKDYYPFGFQMPGLSHNISTADGNLKFSGKEFEAGTLDRYYAVYPDVVYRERQVL